MKRRTALVLVWTLPSAFFLAIAAWVYARYRIDEAPRLNGPERLAAMIPLRAAVDGTPADPCRVRTDAGPTDLVATVWLDGRAIARIEGEGEGIGAAIDSAAAQLRASGQIRGLATQSRARTRIQVDIITGTAPLGGVDAYGVPGVGEMLAVNPGVEGIGGADDGKHALLLPHELVVSKVLAAKRPSNQMPDFAMGIDLKRIGAILGQRAGLPVAVDADDLYRFRTDTFVEPPAMMRGMFPLQLYRGNTVAPKLSAQSLRDAALAGGRFLVAHLAPNGRYIYEHDLGTGRQTDPVRSSSYSMPRHAGTTYFLAELYRITEQEWLREPIERAFKHLADLLAQGSCATTLADGTEIDCVLDKTEKVAQLGSTALAVVALAEYQRATGDARYLPLATKFTAFLLYMQRDDGSFRHLYDPFKKQRDDKTELLYYSGESALALARMYTITNDERYAKAADKALQWLVDWYDFFMGGFFYGEEHWTCIAAEAAWPYSKNPKYMDFCHGYGKFLRTQQPQPGEYPDQDDFVGAYNFTSFVPPYNTPAGSRTEAMISAYLLGRHHGSPDADVRAQIALAMQYALGQQIRWDNDFAVIGPGLGGVPATPIDRNVRIDFVQHVCSAMIRASEWIESPTDGQP
ncbi:MAG: beta-L-arabinofuranosidase domain-containing protein [Kofleriaceae bacterium]